MNRLVAVLLGAALAAAAFGREPSSEGYRAVQESLAQMPAKFQAEWLQRRGLDASRYTEYHRLESTGLTLVGKWGRGISNEVTGRGNLVALTLGSEVALLNVANPDSPVVLSEIQLGFIPVQSALHDSFLLTGGNGIEIWNIADSTHPVFRDVIPYAVSDFAVVDTFLSFGSADTFHIYSTARAASPYELGRCADSGYVVTATRYVAVAKEPNDAMGFIDVSNPAVPKRVGTYPAYALGAEARNTICCAEIYWQEGSEDQFRFEVLDISDPANVVRIGAIDSVSGWDVHLGGPLAFASGYQYPQWEFTIVDLQDSVHPHVISSCTTPGARFGVWADWTSNQAYVADVVGLAVVNTSNINSPVYDTTVMAAYSASDVWLDQERAYVADGEAGLRILDVTNPAEPVELGGIDTLHIYTRATAARDSFAFIDWALTWPPLRSIDVTDPSRPTTAGGCAIFNPIEDMVLKDSLLYLAEYARFQIVNVARPREPALVGSCVLRDESYVSSGLSLVDTLAYVASYPFAIVNVKDPANPVVVGTISRGAWNGSVRDTFLFLSSGGVLVYSVADPTQPRLIDSISLGPNTYWVEAVGTLLYTGNRDGVHVVDATDVHNMRVRGFAATPRDANRLTYKSPYIYASCGEAGVCIFESTQVAIAEPRQAEAEQARKGASVVRGVLFLEAASSRKPQAASLMDVSGRKVMDLHPGANDVRALVPGVYFIREEPQAASLKPQAVRKVVKLK
jgi:hypothetical protein